MFCVLQSSVRGCRFSVMFVYCMIKCVKCSPVPASFFPYLSTSLQSPFFKTSYEQNECYIIHLICCLFYINTGCAAVFMWVCRAAYTILLKYTSIDAVHILFMIANISVTCAAQLPVTERVWGDNVKLQTSFLAHPFLTRLDCRTV